MEHRAPRRRFAEQARGFSREIHRSFHPWLESGTMEKCAMLGVKTDAVISHLPQTGAGSDQAGIFRPNPAATKISHAPAPVPNRGNFFPNL
jgi:hypothetical protein